MKKMKLAPVFILWSSIGFASIKSTFNTLSPQLKAQYSAVDQDITITNMPRFRSQDSLGICFGMSSTTTMQQYMCSEQRKPCKPLDEQEEISPLSMVAWANPNDETRTKGDSTNHSNLFFAGKGYQALGNYLSGKSNSVLPESCYPFDQFANRYGENEEAVNAIVSRLESEYDRSKTEGGVCEECLLNLVQKEFMAKTSIEDIRKKLKANTFQQFLYTAFVGSCEDKRIKIRPHAKLNLFPKLNETASYEQAIVEIKKVLTAGKVVQVDNLCPYLKDEKCMGKHSAVIKGYRRICKKNNKNDCRELVQLHNSWGEDWQKKNDDGWLDAKDLFGDKPLEEASLSWLTPLE